MLDKWPRLLTPGLGDLMNGESKSICGVPKSWLLKQVAPGTGWWEDMKEYRTAGEGKEPPRPPTSMGQRWDIYRHTAENYPDLGYTRWGGPICTESGGSDSGKTEEPSNKKRKL